MFHNVLVVFIFSFISITIAYPCIDGACQVTTHAFNCDINQSEITYNDTDIKEYHFHVYFFNLIIYQLIQHYIFVNN